MQGFEDCAGWFGAEPHASETGHGSAYHLCRTGCAQRRCWCISSSGVTRRTWRKLHLAVDPDTGEILASELTTTADGDASLVGPLLDQISGPIASVTADG